MKEVKPMPIKIFKGKLVCRKPLGMSIDELRKHWVDTTTLKCKDTETMCGSSLNKFY